MLMYKIVMGLFTQVSGQPIRASFLQCLRWKKVNYLFLFTYFIANIHFFHSYSHRICLWLKVRGHKFQLKAACEELTTQTLDRFRSKCVRFWNLCTSNSTSSCGVVHYRIYWELLSFAFTNIGFIVLPTEILSMLWFGVPVKEKFQVESLWSE